MAACGRSFARSLLALLPSKSSRSVWNGAEWCRMPTVAEGLPQLLPLLSPTRTAPGEWAGTRDLQSTAGLEHSAPCAECVRNACRINHACRATARSDAVSTTARKGRGAARSPAGLIPTASGVTDELRGEHNNFCMRIHHNNSFSLPWFSLPWFSLPWFSLPLV